MKVTLKKPPTLSFLNDGRAAEVKFFTDDEQICVAMSGKELESLSLRLNQLVVHLKALQGAKSGLLEIVRSMAIDAAAESDAAGGTVNLVLKGKSGTLLSFCLSPDLCDRLQSQLREAAKEARERGRQTRQ